MHENDHQLTSNSNTDQQEIVTCANEIIPDEDDLVLDEEFPISLDNADIQNFLLKNISKLYAKSSLPLSHADEIVTQFQEISKLVISSLKQRISNAPTLEAAKQILEEQSIEFSDFESQKKFKDFLEKKNFFFEPSAFVVSNETVQSFSSGSVQFENIVHQGTLMPIRSQLKAFLEMPGVFKSIMSNQNDIEACRDDDRYSHLCNGQKWKTIKERNPNKIMLPITLYNDDFQVDDCVGAHSGRNSISAFYYQIATLPQYLMSRLSFIFLALLANAKDLKEDSVDPALYALVDVFSDLEVNGLNITTEDGNDVKIHFVLCNFVGDNLGLHIVCGFPPGFRDKYCCRFCVMPYEAMQRTCRIIDGSLCRTFEHYNNLFESGTYANFGIVRRSLMNRLPSFHVILNKTADIMHDLFLGVFKYDLHVIFQKYVHKFKYSLDFINARIAEQAKIEGFKLSPIKPNHLSKKGNIHFNAREFWFLVEHLPLILPNPTNDNEREVFDFAVLVRKLLQACLLKSYTENDLRNLAELTTNHHQQYLQLSGKPLKPKFHFILHYPEVIRTSGPLRLVLVIFL